MSDSEIPLKKRVELIPHRCNDRVYDSVALPFRGCFKLLARQSRFYDQVLAMAELPTQGELAQILALSQSSGASTVWRRASASPLEINAAALLTALACANRKEWFRLVRGFFKTHGLAISQAGRPHVHPTQRTDIIRGAQIDAYIAKLRPGFALIQSARRRGGFRSSSEQLSPNLKKSDYNEAEITAMIESRTLQDAGCRLYRSLNSKVEHLALSSIRNSYARYKTSDKKMRADRRR